MHLTLKTEATKPAAANALQQLARFDTWIAQDNDERPQQALAMKVPADLYTRSPRVRRGLEDLTYPFHDQTIAITHCGRICFKGRKVNLSHVFAGQNVGVKQMSNAYSGTICRLPTLGGGGLYVLKISDTSELTEDGHFVFALSNSRDWRLYQRRGPDRKSLHHLSLKVSNTIRYFNLPVVGLRTTDAVTAVALVAKF